MSGDREKYTHMSKDYINSMASDLKKIIHQDVCVTSADTFTAWILEELFTAMVNLCHLLSVLLTF